MIERTVRAAMRRESSGKKVADGHKALRRTIGLGCCATTHLRSSADRQFLSAHRGRKEGLRHVRAAVLAIAVILVCSAGAVIAGPSYVYDQIGRLVAVYDSSGNAAVYKYDAVGNLLSITNYSSGQFQALQDSSGSGSVGSTVTLYGTDICSNPTVTFNGINATVSSSTSTQIVVQVPVGATTGQIIVTCGSNQINFGTFTVGSSAPTVTSFSPTVGAAGTAVTVNGSNFQTGTTSNAVRFGITPAPATSATSTAIGTTVPSGASTGHILVTTPAGQAASSGYFYVPPPPATASSLAITGQIAIGGSSVNVTLSTAGTQAVYAFDGTAGQQVSLNITNENFNGTNWADFSVIAPGGKTIASLRTYQSGIISDVNLSTTGTYELLVAPESNNTGSVTLQLYSTADDTGTITIGGPPVNVSIATPGQDASLTFSGTAGQQISLNLTSTNFNGSNWIDVYIIPPGGNTSNALASLRTYQAGIISDVTLPSTSTAYTVFVDPEGANTGSVTLQLFSTSDQTGTIATDGTPSNVSIATPGQDAALTFGATAGEQVNLYLTNTNFNGSNWIDVYIIPPGGTEANAVASLRTYAPTNVIWQANLSTTGTYTVYVDPEGANTGSVTLQLYNLSSGNLSVRGTFSDGNPSGTSISVNLPSTIQVGDLSVVGVSSLSASTFTSPSGWTALLNASGIGVFYKIYQSGDPKSNVTFTGSISGWMAAEGITYIGADQSNPIDSFNSWIFYGNGPYPSYSRAPTLNPNYNGSQLLCGFFGNSISGATFSIPQGLILRLYDVPGPNILLADRALTNGTPTGNFDATGGIWSTIYARGGFQLAIKVAGSSTATAQAVPPSVGGMLTYRWLSANAPVQPNLSALAVQNNDLVVVSFIPDGSTTINPPSGYTAIDSPSGNPGLFQHIWHTGDSTSPSFSFTGSSGYVTPSVAIIRGSGTGVAPQIDQHAFNYSASASSMSAPSLTPTTNTDLLLLIYGNGANSGGTWTTVPSGPTFDINYGAGPSDLIGTLPLTSENPTMAYTAGFSASGGMWAFGIAFSVP